MDLLPRGQVMSEKIIEKILELARARGWKQTEVEQRAGLSQGRLTKWKAKRVAPTAENVYRLAIAFNVTVEYLMDDTKIKPDVILPGGRALSDEQLMILQVCDYYRLDAREAIFRLTVAAVRGTGAEPVPLVPLKPVQERSPESEVIEAEQPIFREPKRRRRRAKANNR